MAKTTMNVMRGMIGDPFGRRVGEMFAHYTFEIDVPSYKWSFDQELGDEFAEWAEDQLNTSVMAVLRKDAARIDAPVGMLKHNMNFELHGPATRELDESGQPVWKEGEWGKLRSGGQREWSYGIQELKSIARDVGNNDTGKLIAAGVMVPKPGETKPYFLIWKKLIVRVNTQALGDLGMMAQKYFAAQDEKRQESIIARRIATREKNKRSAASKRGWRSRKRRMKVEAGLRKDLAKSERQIVSIMYDYLMSLAEKTNATTRNKSRRKRPIARRGSKRTSAKTKPEAQKHPRRRNR